MFEKSLTDLIRGLRSSAKRHREQEFISKCVGEIQAEIKSDDLDLKSEAVAKLCYLHMLGFDMSWAAFHIIELMSCNQLEKKRIGYLCSTFVFNQSNPVLMLATNLIKKDLSSNVYSESCIALHSLAQIVSHDLARDLTVDLMGMLKHSSPGLKKRSILVLFRMFVQYPESLQLAFPPLKDKLHDADPAVVLAAINVIVELGTRHPKSYLFLAPTFFQLLQSSKSVWGRLKIVKLFASFARIEPRLIKKLIDPFSVILNTTNALSLMYECIKTCIHGGFIISKDDFQDRTSQDLLDLICQKLKMLLSFKDINLIVLSLEALKDLLIIRPDIASYFAQSAFKALENGELTVRIHALELVPKMVTHDNFLDLMQNLMSHLSQSHDDLGSAFSTDENDYRTKVACCMLEIITKDTFQYVDDFEWIVDLLVEISRISGLNLGHRLSEVMIDINLRVAEVREYAVAKLLQLVATDFVDIHNREILISAGFIIGEYPHFVPISTNVFLVLTEENVALLPSEVQGVYIQSSFKLFSFWLGNISGDYDFQPVSKLYTDQLEMFSTSEFLEVQQRSCQFLYILRNLSARAAKMDSKEEAISFLHQNSRFLFDEELNPTLPTAQQLVVKPSEINLDEWIHEDFSLGMNIEDYFSEDETVENIKDPSIQQPVKPNNSFQNDVYYISEKVEQIMVDDIPIVDLDEKLDDLQTSPTTEQIIVKKPKKYNIKRDVDLPKGVSLGHALSPIVKAENKITDDNSFALTTPVFQSRADDAEFKERVTEKKPKRKKKNKDKDHDQRFDKHLLIYNHLNLARNLAVAYVNGHSFDFQMQKLKKDINLKWKPYIISFIVCLLLSLVGVILSTATWDSPRSKFQMNYDAAFSDFESSLNGLPNNSLPPTNSSSNGDTNTGGNSTSGRPSTGGSTGGNTSGGNSGNTNSGNSGGSNGGSSNSGNTRNSGNSGNSALNAWFWECLNTHNTYRGMMEKTTDRSGLVNFVWGNDLARDAYSWARHLADINSGLKHSTVFGHGENLYSETNGGKTCKAAVDAFFNEYTLYNNEKIGDGDFHAYGHFTQVAWPSSTRLGCAFADNRNTRYTVCHYDPPGNFLGQRLNVRVRGKSSY